MKKYELTDETIEFEGHTLHRIRLCNGYEFRDQKEYEISRWYNYLGGFVESEENLAQDSDAWIYGNAKVFGEARVYENAQIFDDAVVCDDAQVYGYAEIKNNARVCQSVNVYGNARIWGNANISVYTDVCGNAKIYDHIFIPSVNGKIDNDHSYVTMYPFADRLVALFYKTQDDKIAARFEDGYRVYNYLDIDEINLDDDFSEKYKEECLAAFAFVKTMINRKDEESGADFTDN